MESRAHALIAGMFVVLFAGFALMALWWFGGQREALREVVMVAQQPVNGLNPQSTVRYRGVRVGKVTEIRFSPGHKGEILVRLAINEETPLTDKTVGRLAFQGVTGLAFVQLDEAPGESKLLGSGSVQIPLLPSQMSEGIDSGLETLRQVKEVTSRINLLLDDENRARVARTLSNVDQLSGHALKAGEQLPEVLERLRRLASDENIARLSSSLRNTADTTAQAGEAVKDVRQLAANLNAVAARLDSMLARVDTEALATAPGKVGEMADQVKQAAASVDRVARSLEERPEGLIFGKDKREPGPGEAGFPGGTK